MINKKAVTFLTIIFSMIIFTGCIFVQPDSNEKIKETSMKYLKDKYKEEFIVKRIITNIDEGDLVWRYYVEATPKNDPNLTIAVNSLKNMSGIEDNYKTIKWSDVRTKQLKKDIEKAFGKVTYLSVGLFTNDEIANKYSINDNPLDIITKEANFKIDSASSIDEFHQPIHEYICITVGVNNASDIDEDKLSENILSLIKYYNDLNLYLHLDLTYGKEGYLNKNGTAIREVARIILESNHTYDKNSIKSSIKYKKS